MKRVLAFVFLCAVLSIATEPFYCGIVKIDTTFLIYRFDDNGMWVQKYLGLPPKGHKIVYTSKLSKSTGWSCLVKDGFGRYSIAEGRCNSRRDRFLSIIKNGESLKIHIENGYDPFAVMGYSKPVSWMECHPDSIVFHGVNELTDQPTDLKVYRNLPPGTYCEDFVASDALYWKP